MRRHVLVTLADESFLEPAQQLFACVHHKAGWDGDLLLLAHDVPEARLAPFRERGILVEPCAPWVETDVVDGEERPFHPPTVLSKFDVFGPPMRRWENVVYLDGDMMFWASLEPLARVRGLAAVCERRLLAGQYSRRAAHPELARELEAGWDLSRPAFNSGLLAFRTADVIRDDTRDRLRALWRRYRALQAHPFGDQPALNLAFQDRWTLLPDFWAAIRDHSARWFFLDPEAMPVIGRHFAGHPRPWHAEHPLHAEWRANLASFESLDARRPRPPAARWSGWRRRRTWWALRARRARGRAAERAAALRKRLRRTAPARRARHAAGRLRQAAASLWKAAAGGRGPQA